MTLECSHRAPQRSLLRSDVALTPVYKRRLGTVNDHVRQSVCETSQTQAADMSQYYLQDAVGTATTEISASQCSNEYSKNMSAIYLLVVYLRPLAIIRLYKAE
jgi:hypothetical protein